MRKALSRSSISSFFGFCSSHDIPDLMYELTPIPGHRLLLSVLPGSSSEL